MLEPLPTLRSPDRPASPYAKGLPATAALDWLRAGWRDLRMSPGSSLAYGLFLTLASYAVLWLLKAGHLLYLALPALSGFLIIGPFLAVGLYEKSRRQGQGGRVSVSRMLAFRPASKEDRASWEWDGDIDAPTLSPSVHNVGHWHGWLHRRAVRRCAGTLGPRPARHRPGAGHGRGRWRGLGGGQPGTR